MFAGVRFGVAVLVVLRFALGVSGVGVVLIVIVVEVPPGCGRNFAIGEDFREPCVTNAGVSLRVLY